VVARPGLAPRRPGAGNRPRPTCAGRNSVVHVRASSPTRWTPGTHQNSHLGPASNGRAAWCGWAVSKRSRVMVCAYRGEICGKNALGHRALGAGGSPARRLFRPGRQKGPADGQACTCQRTNEPPMMSQGFVRDAPARWLRPGTTRATRSWGSTTTPTTSGCGGRSEEWCARTGGQKFAHPGGKQGPELPSPGH